MMMSCSRDDAYDDMEFIVQGYKMGRTAFVQ